MHADKVTGGQDAGARGSCHQQPGRQFAPRCFVGLRRFYRVRASFEGHETRASTRSVYIHVVFGLKIVC